MCNIACGQILGKFADRAGSLLVDGQDSGLSLVRKAHGFHEGRDSAINLIGGSQVTIYFHREILFHLPGQPLSSFTHGNIILNKPGADPIISILS